MDSTRSRSNMWLPAFIRALLLSMPAVCVSGTSAAAVDSKALDARIEVWKDRAIDTATMLEQAEEQQNCPAGSLTVYLGMPDLYSVSALVTLTLDAGAAVERSYDSEHVAALSRQRLDRLVCLTVPPGSHHLIAALQWRDSRHGPDSPPNRAHYEGDIEISAGENLYQLTLENASLLSSVDLILDHRTATDENVRSRWSVAKLLPSRRRGAYVPGDLNDPELQYARYLAECHERLHALARLRLIAKRAPAAADTRIELSRRLLDFGAYSSADSVIGELEGTKANQSVVQKLRIQQANLRYRQGNIEAAEAAIPKASGLSAKQPPDWQDISFRVLMARGQLGDASDLALAMKNNADYESYVRYFNLGVALIQNGRYGQGATVLDRIGTIASHDGTMRALVDRANLSLAMHFLQRQQAASAIPVLSRIHSEGPYGSQAILALGWSWLLPAGEKQARLVLGDERVTGPPPESIGGRVGNNTDSNLYQRYRVHPFERTSLPAEESARLNRALAAWAELIDRDRAEPPVREGLVAIAGALDRLGAHDDATRYYEIAIEALSSTVAELADAQRIAQGEPWMDAVHRRDDRMEPGGHWTLRDLPTRVLTQHLRDAIAGNAFQEALQNLRDLAALQEIFLAFEGQLAERNTTNEDLLNVQVALNSWRLDMADDQEQQRSELREMASSVLRQQASRVTDLLAQTRLAMARRFDNRTESREVSAYP